jgi:GT2 family glycosyltransferase
MLKDISVIIVTYNHKKYIENCLNSINDMSLEIIVVDNCSCDGTPDLIEKKFPKVKLIKNKKNSGYGSAVNLGINQSSKNYVIILNPDVKVEKKSIEELIKPIIKNNNLITTPKALLYDGSRINTCGNIEHFTGLTFTFGLGKSIEEFNMPMYISGVSGVCFAISRELFLDLGGFDESLFLYMEDAELSWNIKSKGLKILYIPSAIIYHDYVLKVPTEKIYHLERGRYIILKKYFTWKEYLMFSPSLIVAELFTGGYSLLKGISGIKFKMRAIKDGLNTDVKKIECNRRQLIHSFDWKVPEGQLSYNFLDNYVRKVGNFIFFINYSLILNLWDLKSKKIESSVILNNKQIEE